MNPVPNESRIKRELTLLKPRVVNVLREHIMLHLTEAGMSPEAVANLHIDVEEGSTSQKGITLSIDSESTQKDQALMRHFVNAMELHSGEGSSFVVQVNDNGEKNNVTLTASDAEQLVSGISHALSPAYKLTLDEAKRRRPGWHRISSDDPDFNNELEGLFGSRSGTQASDRPTSAPSLPELPFPKELLSSLNAALGKWSGKRPRANEGGKLDMLARKLEDAYLASLMPDTHATYHAGVDFRKILRQNIDFRPIQEKGWLKIIVEPAMGDPFDPNDPSHYYTPGEESFKCLAITPRRFYDMANQLRNENGNHGTFSCPWHNDGILSIQARTLEDLAKGINSILPEEQKVDMSQFTGKSRQQ